MRESLALADPASPVWAAVDAAIGDGAEAAFSFLERLVAVPSTVGRELPAQQIVAAELARLGFAVAELPVPAEAADAAPGGVAQASYAGRSDVLARSTRAVRPRCCWPPAARGFWPTPPCCSSRRT